MRIPCRIATREREVYRQCAFWHRHDRPLCLRHWLPVDNLWIRSLRDSDEREIAAASADERHLVLGHLEAGVPTFVASGVGEHIQTNGIVELDTQISSDAVNG